VITEPPIDPAQFVACVQPLLAGMDLQGLADLLKSRFTKEQVTELFACDNPDARKVAALVFGLIGCKQGMCRLADLLKDPDPMVNQMAEHAMWTIWFRSGANDEANRELCRGTKAMNRRDFDTAVEHFDRAIEADPNFAEAYNQRALLRYLQERYDECIVDCKQVVRLMPHHFGAWAGLGHCYVHLGRLKEAVRCYEKVLSIHPSFGGVPQVVEELRRRSEHGEEG
jgi:tetratricopeptide (TPR) repeat protein